MHPNSAQSSATTKRGRLTGALLLVAYLLLAFVFSYKRMDRTPPHDVATRLLMEDLVDDLDRDNALHNFCVGVEDWHGEAAWLDAWGRPILVTVRLSTAEELRSRGMDGKLHTKDDIVVMPKRRR